MGTAEEIVDLHADPDDGEQVLAVHLMLQEGASFVDSLANQLIADGYSLAIEPYAGDSSWTRLRIVTTSSELRHEFDARLGRARADQTYPIQVWGVETVSYPTLDLITEYSRRRDELEIWHALLQRGVISLRFTDVQCSIAVHCTGIDRAVRWVRQAVAAADLPAEWYVIRS